MPLLEVVTNYLAHELWLVPECLGSTYTETIDDLEVTIAVPGVPADLDNPYDSGTPRLAAASHAPGYFGTRGQIFRLHVFIVRVKFEGDVLAKDKPPNGAPNEIRQEFLNKVQQLWDHPHKVAEEIAGKFLQWLRAITTQPWLGVAAEKPQQHGVSYLRDVKSGLPLGGWGPLNTATFHSDQFAADNSIMSRAALEALKRSTPSVGQSLLADAGALTNDVEIADNARAILSAASACEIEVKRTLRNTATTGTSDMIDIILKKHSGLDLLCNQCMKAIIGRSLKEIDPSLNSQITTLASTRNRIIHQGLIVQDNDARNLIGAARRLFDILHAIDGHV
ncbi:hypothetical protein AB0C24_19725 [Amycolatopsis japonica]|uniref:hypothetical protein n=1 Tax=Amycolatopsis japonica TaxID=208439 RepID=UPI0033EB0FAA